MIFPGLASTKGQTSLRLHRPPFPVDPTGLFSRVESVCWTYLPFVLHKVRFRNSRRDHRFPRILQDLLPFVPESRILAILLAFGLGQFVTNLHQLLAENIGVRMLLELHGIGRIACVDAQAVPHISLTENSPQALVCSLSSVGLRARESRASCEPESAV